MRANLGSGWRKGVVGLLAILFVAGSANAVTATYSLSSSGGTGILSGNALACTSLLTCLAGTPDFENIALAGASGVLDLVDSGGGLSGGSLTLSIPSLVLAGAPLGGVDEIILSGLSVSFSFGPTDVLEVSLGGGLLNLLQIGPPAAATMTGTVEGLLGGGTVVGPSAFSETVTLSALNCVVAPGQCGFQLDFSSVVGSPLDFRVTANLNVVPEAGMLGLMVLSALGAGALRRRA